MGNFYDDSKFGVVRREWFGLPKAHGGASVPYTIGSATAVTHLARWYPKGPVEILKVGAYVTTALATAANATGSSLRERIPFRIYKSNAAGASMSTLLASFHIVSGDSDRLARYGIASKETMASAVIEQKRYVTIRSGSAVSDSGSEHAAAGTVLDSGSFAFFIDWRPKQDLVTGVWDN
jgi:hypothetical protein